jgi:broad specificity phosphatase PhoE
MFIGYFAIISVLLQIANAQYRKVSYNSTSGEVDVIEEGGHVNLFPELSKKKKYIFLIRNAQRDEVLHGLFAKDHDLVITDEGKQQAERTGKFIKKYLSDIGCEGNPLVYCSPRVRTIQTAARISQALGVKNVNVHDGFIDSYDKERTTTGLDKLPLFHSYVNDTLSGLDEFRGFYDLEEPRDLNITYDGKYFKEIENMHPENESNLKERVIRFTDEIMSHLLGTDDLNSAVIVTHENIVKTFSKIYTGKALMVRY